MIKVIQPIPDPSQYGWYECPNPYNPYHPKGWWYGLYGWVEWVKKESRHMDVLFLAQQDTQLHRASVNEQAGPCPGCGGDDRFRVKYHDEKWVFMCRGCWNSQEILSPEAARACGKPQRAGEKRGWGDVIDYLR